MNEAGMCREVLQRFSVDGFSIFDAMTVAERAELVLLVRGGVNPWHFEIACNSWLQSEVNVSDWPFIRSAALRIASEQWLTVRDSFAFARECA